MITENGVNAGYRDCHRAENGSIRDFTKTYTTQARANTQLLDGSCGINDTISGFQPIERTEGGIGRAYRWDNIEKVPMSGEDRGVFYARYDLCLEMELPETLMNPCVCGYFRSVMMAKQCESVDNRSL